MPVDRGAIDGQLKDIGEGERWWEQREFRDLPYILHADERLRGIVNGRLLGRRRPRLGLSAWRAPWLIVVTDQRLICLKQERFARKQVEIAPGQITGIHHTSRIRAHQIMIETGVRRYRLRIAKPDAFRFSGALAGLLPKQPLLPGTPPAPEGTTWLPGAGAVAALPGGGGLLSRFTRAAPGDYASRAHVERLEATVERLLDDVERLQQQVAFMENLLQTRSEEAFLQRLPAPAQS
ncbi:MAG TPA: PH domain-containing protein [Longimicrobium sp.]|nr:PH domain-containing protein [Longimicrobium sp.]